MATDSAQGEANSSEDNSDRLKLLYPAVDERDTSLPRSWSSKDKFSFIGLSHNNLRVHYKGTGKSHKDAASVRATHPIPASCGIYYFEVKVISKGRDGYMGIGLSTQGVSMNRLPGWDKHAYGYHGDDGNSFCSSGAGQPYGPTFTTGDTIGCCINLIEKTCFYTKNGINLGVAFTDLPAKLYPTVGLQTPGEVVEANFGQSPFVFDIMDYMKEWKMKTKMAIERFTVSDQKGEFQSALQKIVSTYLVHHGYCSSAEAFSKSTGQPIMESIESIRNRQRVQKLVLAGRMGEAIETTQRLYPHLLENKPDLLFMLKCRQFVEMVNGTDSEVRLSKFHTSSGNSSCVAHNNSNSSIHNSSTSSNNSTSHGRSTRLYHGNDSGSNRSSPAHSPHPYVRSGTPPSHQHHQHSQYHHSQHQQQHRSSRNTPTNSACNSPNRSTTNKSPGRHSPSFSSSIAPNSNSTNASSNNFSSQVSPLSSSITVQQQHPAQSFNNSMNGNSDDGIISSLNNNNRLDNNDTNEVGLNSNNSVNNCDQYSKNDSPRYIQDGDKDVDMLEKGSISNGSSVTNGGTECHQDEDMDVDTPTSQTLMCGGNEVAIERMLEFGRDLKMMSQRLRKEFGKNEANKRTLQDAFSLLAYSDPWNSPIGSQLLPVKREPVCAALNSAILESKGLPKQPPLELALAQANQCVQLMAKSGVASCAFASVSDYLH